jgi:hypothetical protein
VPHIQPLSRWMAAVEAESTTVSQPQHFEGVLAPEVAFDRVLPSWNCKHHPGQMKLEVRVEGPKGQSNWILLTAGTSKGPNWWFSDGELGLKFSGARLRYRATFVPDPQNGCSLTLLAFNFANSKFFGPSPGPKRNVAWGRSVALPEAVSINTVNDPFVKMALSAFQDLLLATPPSVPTSDSILNALALASAQGMVEAYQTRMTSIADLERWIAWEIPIICWLDDGNQPRRVLLTGFTATGDPLLAEPGKGPRKVSRAAFEQSWLGSFRRVAIIHPSVVYTPADEKSIWMMGHSKDAPNHLGNPGGG